MLAAAASGGVDVTIAVIVSEVLQSCPHPGFPSFSSRLWGRRGLGGWRLGGRTGRTVAAVPPQLGLTQDSPHSGQDPAPAVKRED